MADFKKVCTSNAGAQKTRQLLHIRNAYRDKNIILKYAKASGRYFFNYNAPGWPSKAFDRYVSHQLNKTGSTDTYTGIHTLIFGITTKCGYQCEHCFEWKSLNKPEVLSRDELVKIVKKFQQIGVSQIQLSGGEPLNRLDDILHILKQANAETDFWMYTSGYHLSLKKAGALKAAGLTGVALSLDHWNENLHDRFRGKKGAFKWVTLAASNAMENGLAVCLSLCATRQFVTEDNLDQYAAIALQLKVCFIQILEPRAVGHYEGMDVSLGPDQIVLLEKFYTKMNFDAAYRNYPAVTYHGFYSRRLGCSGSGADFLYVDMDGDAHACPFCQNKKFNVLTADLAVEIGKMKKTGCKAF